MQQKVIKNIRIRPCHFTFKQCPHFTTTIKFSPFVHCRLFSWRFKRLVESRRRRRCQMSRRQDLNVRWRPRRWKFDFSLNVRHFFRRWHYHFRRLVISAAEYSASDFFCRDLNLWNRFDENVNRVGGLKHFSNFVLSVNQKQYHSST